MIKNVTMKGKDSIFAALAECFVTIEGRRYNFMQAINLEAKFEKNKTEVPILGKTGRGNKASGWKGTGSATFHYNTSIFRQLMVKYKETGEDIYFEMQISNEDIITLHIVQGTSARKQRNTYKIRQFEI